MTNTAKSTPEVAPMALPTLKTIFAAMEARFKLTPRESQIKLASRVRDTLSSAGISVFEAPTGTGKTLGYLTGALEAQAHSPSPIPVVVATATVGLQEQILRFDIPRLAAVGAVDPRRVAVAKGRGRYFCPRTAALLDEKKSQDGQFDMFQPDKHVADSGTQIALDMLKAWRVGDWDGDRDNWVGTIPECWTASCGASSDTCVGRSCEHYDACPYMKSRAKLGQAQVIIANHDMVLADLTQRAEEQQSTALPPKKYMLIFDEAHNLPEKAVDTKRATANLSQTDWIRGLAEFGERCLSTHRVAHALSKQDIAADVFSVKSALLAGELERLDKELATKREFDVSGVSSWGLAEPEKELREQVWQLAGHSEYLLDALKACAKAYSDCAEEATGADKAFAIRMLSQAHKYARQMKDLYMGFEMFCTNDRLVRWLTRDRDGHLSLQSQPLEGQDVLNELLWKTDFSVTMVSATLQIAGSFERFRAKSGLPGHAVTESLPPVFDYTRGYLHQPRMELEPNAPGWEAEVASKLPKLYHNNVSPGMLVLFTSRESMRRVVRMLPEDMASRVLVQDHRPIPELVAQHKARIDKGERSVLIGLDSMSEGLDLPGSYCGHVVITRLPFAVPGDPVEEARREHLGKAWFEQAYLADMLTMLIQAAGRLIRREDDYGVITLLDKRMSTKRYAKQAMAALPNFTRGTNLQGYFDMLKERALDAKVVVAPPRPAAAAPVPARTKASTVKAPASASRAEPVVAEHPLASLWRLKEVPVSTGRPTTCNPETLPGVLHRTLPFDVGPFQEEDVDYMAKSKTAPCLPPGTPASLWGERQMPQAVMLGLRLMNMDWDESKPGWMQVLGLRADLVQFAEVLRSHEQDWPDARRELLPADVCAEQLAQGLAGLGCPGSEALFGALTTLEAEAVLILGGSHKQPSRQFMAEMPQAALMLGLQLRKHRG